MAEQRFLQLSDDELGAALSGLAPAVAWPDARLAPDGPDLATRVRARLAVAPASRRGSTWRLRPALVLALVALFALAAVAGAVAFGVPGIRLIFGDPGATPPPAVASPTAPSSTGGASAPPAGSSLDLGDQVDPASLADRVDFRVLFPNDPALGAPDAAYVSERDEVALVWAPNDDLPPTVEPDIGLLIMQFRGSVRPEPIGKIISSGTVVEPVQLGDGTAYWITGDPHVFFYMSPEGEYVDEGRRWVGDALIWQRGVQTYRIETSLGRDAAVRIAESLE